MTPDRSLIVVEDDAGFARTLKRSFERRGYEVVLAASIEEVRKVLEERSFGYAVVAMRPAPSSEYNESRHARELRPIVRRRPMLVASSPEFNLTRGRLRP